MVIVIMERRDGDTGTHPVGWSFLQVNKLFPSGTDRGPAPIKQTDDVDVFYR